MTSQTQFEYVQYEERGNVGVWTITDLAAFFQSDELKEGEEHYRSVASDDQMRGTVIVLKNAEKIGREMRDSLDHISDQWSMLADEVDVDRVAYVAEGMMSSVVSAKIDADVETDAFDDLDEALNWVGE